MSEQEPEHLRITYNEVHNLIRASAAKIAEWKPDLLIAIGMSFCRTICSHGLTGV